MCGRFTLRDPRRIKLNHIDYVRYEDWVPRYNIAPSQDVVTIVERDSQREATLLQWGLIPYWSKEAKGFINTRVETIEQKSTFKDSFQRRRCLIPADGFYEWERNGKISQPYFFQMKDEAPFAFAGIWDRWHADDRTITSCAIITTTANELLAEIHHRMPVILRPESYDLWLHEESRAADLKEILIPYPASEMVSHTVSRDVNDTKIDDEHLVQPAGVDVGVNLRLF
ncbi:MAG TPA: SOS response-associated peptidase [Pyrinomonadaceae bacterium]